MADLLGTALSVGNGYSTSSQSNSDILVEAYKKSVQKPIDDLKSKRAALEKRQVSLNSLRSKLESFSSQLTTFSVAADNVSKVSSKKVSSSDTAIAKVSATSEVSVGINALKVERLAANDILVSDRKTLADASGFSVGTKAFGISVNGTSSNISVEFDGTETNEQALNKIVSAINGVTDGKISASVVKDTSTTGKLTLTSKTTGSDNKITFTDTDNVLSQFGISSALYADTANRTVFSTTSAGFQKSNSANLDSQIQINGITINRGTNSITDAINGLTINLLKPQAVADQELTLTTELDPQTASSNIRPLLDNYNEVIRFISKESNTFKSDLAVKNLQSNLRQAASNANGSGTFQYLSDIGIKIDADGSLTVKDVDKLSAAMKSSPKDITELLENFSKKMQSAMTGILGDSGSIATSKTSITQQIKTLNQRTTRLEKQADLQAENLRKQYEKMQALYIKAQQQSSYLAGFASY